MFIEMRDAVYTLSFNDSQVRPLTQVPIGSGLVAMATIKYSDDTGTHETTRQVLVVKQGESEPANEAVKEVTYLVRTLQGETRALADLKLEQGLKGELVFDKHLIKPRLTSTATAVELDAPSA